MKLAFGPRKRAGSWDWVGHDIAHALGRQSQKIVFFDSFDNMPSADVIFAIKFLPPQHIVRRNRVIYFPVDLFASEQEIHKLKDTLSLCRIIAVSEPNLMSCFSFCRKVRFVEHYNKFALPLLEYKDKGYALWTGRKEHLSVFYDTMRTTKLPLPVRAIANIKSTTFHNKYGQDIKVYTWSEKTQKSMMTECKAGVDIKGGSFYYLHKPVEKAQQFICANIPLAMNRPSSGYDYFHQLGLEIPEPGDDRWISREYWEDTRKIAKLLRPKLTKDRIATQYLQLARECVKIF